MVSSRQRSSLHLPSPLIEDVFPHAHAPRHAATPLQDNQYTRDEDVIFQLPAQPFQHAIVTIEHFESREY